MRKIILITHEFAPFRGGIATYCEEVSLAAHRLGYPIEVWTQGCGDRDHEFPFPVRRLAGKGNLRPLSLLALAWELWKRTDELKVARVCLASRGAQWVYLNLEYFLNWDPGTQITALFHGTEILRYARSGWLNARARHFFDQKTHRIGVNSKSTGEQLKEQGWGSVGERAQLAPCGLRQALRQALMPPKRLHEDGKLRVLTLARVHPRKGQLEVIRALALLPETLRRRVIYQIAGIGEQDYFDQIKSEAHTLGVVLEIQGEIPEVKIPEVYRQADLYVMASRTRPDSIEGFGMTYLEAGWYELPVIGTRTGGVAEAIQEGVTGLLVPENDAGALSKALLQLLEDESLRRAFGVAGRQQAERMDWDTAAKILFEKK